MSTEKTEKVPCHTLGTQEPPARQPISSSGAHTFNDQLSSNVSGIAFATPPSRSNQLHPTCNTEVPEPMRDSFACSTRSYPSTLPQLPRTDIYTTSSELPTSPFGKGYRGRRRSRTYSHVTDVGQSPRFSVIRSEKVELVMKNTRFVLGALDTDSEEVKAAYRTRHFKPTDLLLNHLKPLSFNATPFDPLRMRLILLIAYTLCIVYNGMAAFQYCELSWGPFYYGVLDSLYIIVVTLSTVGYGDITPQTDAGRIVIILLITVSLTLIPGLISGTLETLKNTRAGRGQYNGKSKFVIVCGNFDTVARTMDVLHAFFDLENDKRDLRLVFLSRKMATTEIKALLQTAMYKHRVTFLHGSALQAKRANAVFIISDRKASNPFEEDERNTLRVWSFYDYISSNATRTTPTDPTAVLARGLVPLRPIPPEVPIYVHNLLSQTETYQKMAKKVMCGKEFKEILMGYNCLYKGSSTLIINLMYHHQLSETYHKSWQAQYGDGMGNEIYSAPINPNFVGLTFAQASWVIYKEFQVILFAIKIFIQDLGTHHLMLNPGNNYALQPDDECIFIAQTPTDINVISSMSTDGYNRVSHRYSTIFEFQNAINDNDTVSGSATNLSENGPVNTTEELHVSNLCKSSTAQLNPSHLIRLHRQGSTGNLDDIVIGQPEPLFFDAQVPFCHLLKSPVKCIGDVLLKDGTELTGHILVCLCGKTALFRFLCTLRSAYISGNDFRDIVILSPRLLTEDEFRIVAAFPRVFYVQGECRNKHELLRAGVKGANKIVIMGQQYGGEQQNHYADSAAIMTSHLIHEMLLNEETKKYVIIELSERTNTRFMHILQINDSNSADFFRTSVYASGNVAIETPFDYVTPSVPTSTVPALWYLYCLYATYYKPYILDIVKLLCGLRHKRLTELDQHLGIDPSSLCHAEVPAEYVGRTFADLYQDFALRRGIIPIGLFRAADRQEWGNEHPFVYTNPVPAIVLKETDLVYVLTMVENPRS
ncbi:hypothetical protein BC937DRAFT_87152 [Endogone sp. FLAS-F59071]|nr:hypothetical protein BC937DRAFT_87152 [Endogone sp. FLAS-F59071]|eukprot:RUS19651.1 hypothetical protein BC937DRAFT_87152 [Endogone sp. FLAS-F59071]